MSAKTTTIDTIGTSSGWLAYCKTIALGSRLPATQAKICLNIGEPTPSRAMRKTERDLEQGRIDSASYTARINAIEAMEDMHKRGVQTHKIDTPTNDWHTLSGGGHMRRTHGSNYNG